MYYLNYIHNKGEEKTYLTHLIKYHNKNSILLTKLTCVAQIVID